MGNDKRHQRTLRAASASPAPAATPAHALLDMGAVTAEDLASCMPEAAATGASLADVCHARGLIDARTRAEALARQYRSQRISVATTPPDPALIAALPPDFCLRHAVLPWARVGEATLVATARPDRFADIEPQLPESLHPVIMAVTTEADIHEALLADAGTRDRLRRMAETSVPESLSARGLGRRGTLRKTAVLALLAALALLIIAPRLFFLLALGTTLGALAGSVALKVAAVLANLLPSRDDDPSEGPGGGPGRGGPAEGTVHEDRSAETGTRREARLQAGPHAMSHGPAATRAGGALARGAAFPSVALLVPLFREERTVPQLLARLNALAWPRTALEALLVVEESDEITRRHLAGQSLPHWIKVVVVPAGEICTKPRAMNYALDFTDADIVGIFDAEDAPAPDVIASAVEMFRQGPPEVACIQGALDHYNARASWMARCFAIEYAAWFRVILPGLERLGLVLPLGGTGLFFRREALEAVGRWDSHNVTEDADLGVRLARFGLATRIGSFTTEEEANDRPWRWIRQRSRWLKGYMVTWLVHMRQPLRLWRDLGPWRFAGFQLLFLGALLQFLLAPFLWSFLSLSVGLDHPFSAWFGEGLPPALLIAFLGAECMNMTAGMIGAGRTAHKGLELWVPCLVIYFLLAVPAVYKALAELVIAPFYWDKTAHGHSLHPAAAGASMGSQPGGAEHGVRDGG